MEEALKISPSNIYFLNNLAISHHKKGNLSDAEKYFLKALKVNPEYINVLNNFGNLKKDLDQVEEAIKLYEKSVKVKSDILITNYNLASMYLGVGKYNEALKYFKNTLKINPNFTTADRTISLITKYTGDNEHFREMLEKFKNSNLNDLEKIELNFALGKAYEDTQYDLIIPPDLITPNATNNLEIPEYLGEEGMEIFNVDTKLENIKIIRTGRDSYISLKITDKKIIWKKLSDFWYSSKFLKSRKTQL